MPSKYPVLKPTEIINVLQKFVLNLSNKQVAI